MEQGERRRLEELEGKYLRRRVLVLPCVIDDYVADRVLGHLDRLIDRDPAAGVWLLIRSPGGSVEAGLRLIEAMDQATVPVGTFAIERADGIAAAILAHGVRGWRVCQTNTRVRLTAVWTEAPLLQQRAVELQGAVSRLLARDTGQSVRHIARDTAAEREFARACDAVAYGLADRVADAPEWPTIPCPKPTSGPGARRFRASRP